MPRKPAADSRPESVSPSKERRDGRRTTLPGPVASDFEDVEWALEAAANLWKSGDDSEALKWLRRAATAAAERDADARAVELYKAAADIASELDTFRKPLPPSGDRARAALDAVPMPHLARRFEDSEEDTFVRPGTKLRRALLAIDPAYGNRIDYSEDDDEVHSLQGGSPLRSRSADPVDSFHPAASSTADAPPDSGSAPSRGAGRSNTSELETARRMSAAPEPRPIPGALPTARVAVLSIPDEGDVRIVFLRPGEIAPPGVAVALLVPQTDEDAQRLARIYAESNSKL